MPETNAMERSVSELVQLIEMDADNWSAYVDLIGALVLSNALPEAEELGLKSLTLFADNPEAVDHLLYAVGNVYYTAGAYDRAQTFFDRITLESLRLDAALMQAQSLYGQGQYKKALAFALTYTEKVPTDVDGHVLLGRVWLALNNLDTAKDMFDKALGLDADHYGANFGRGVVAVSNGDAQHNEWLEKAKQLNPVQFKSDAEQLDGLLTVLGGN
ncbi:tetratricopeptide repeat protein [Weissella tructae]|uniref:Tetratricopeptide TPR_2 repeat protein n=2 Tax=Weissella TaxID=46255 RepID=A0A075TYE9_9LACO|nr:MULTISPECIES: tetratricopeptide repeat protein [Weissella]AIG65250.1 Tetratricopeptide TPR_2 repeat protein [Weissella tructae]AIM62563.1 Tetratricopeptide TPR_2 repeat protein [Weissella ceti]AIM63899.1 Tetratricopeptide TPR_2 repeat protein [Weissella ceti]ELA07650.1 hypothetical protein WCNC_01565 [Weissella ceti NC36]QVV91628.1 tetratricopeptide repeat protein [Weissella tructae]